MCILIFGVAVIVAYDAAFHEIDKRINDHKKQKEKDKNELERDKEKA